MSENTSPAFRDKLKTCFRDLYNQKQATEPEPQQTIKLPNDFIYCTNFAFSTEHKEDVPFDTLKVPKPAKRKERQKNDLISKLGAILFTCLRYVLGPFFGFRNNTVPDQKKQKGERRGRKQRQQNKSHPINTISHKLSRG